MEWLAAVAEAYSAANQYYKDREQRQYMDAVLSKLEEIDRTTKATLDISIAILRWTLEAPKLIRLYSAMADIKAIGQQMGFLIRGLGESSEKDKNNKAQIVELHREVTGHTIVLKNEGGYAAFPQVACGVAVILIANAQRGLLSKGTLKEFLKAMLEWYRECLREIPDVSPQGQKGFGWQAIHAREVREQYLPYLEDARRKSFKDRLVITSRGEPAGDYPSDWESCGVAGLNGNWNDGFAGISSFGTSFFPPADQRFLVNFERATDTKSLPERIRLAPIDYRREGGDARSHGDHVAGELNGMIQARNWAAKNEALIIEACATLRILIHEIEQILGPKASAATPEIPYDQREPIIFER